jgi:putative FmdB family regulatory protein
MSFDAVPDPGPSTWRYNGKVPIYEYEPADHDCLMCDGRIEVMQGINDAALEYCPYCGLPVRRVISRASIQIAKGLPPDAAAKRGFTTFRKLERGRYEKVAGEGPEMIVKTSDQQELEAAAKDPHNEIVE